MRVGDDQFGAAQAAAGEAAQELDPERLGFAVTRGHAELSSDIRRSAAKPIISRRNAIIIEVVTPVCIVSGWHNRLAAFVLAGFCVVTAVMYHQFWCYPEFWRSKEGKGLQHFWEFLKNFGLVGGLGLIMLASHTLPLTEVARHPLASTFVSGPTAGAVR